MSAQSLVSLARDASEFVDHFCDIDHLLEDKHNNVTANQITLQCEGLTVPYQVVEDCDSAFGANTPIPYLKGSEDSAVKYVLLFSNDPTISINLDEWLKDTDYEYRRVLTRGRIDKKPVDFYMIGLKSWKDTETVLSTIIYADVGKFSCNGHIFYSGEQYYDHYNFT